jgi:uncharacterized RDD family membrane protein YckC
MLGTKVGILMEADKVNYIGLFRRILIYLVEMLILLAPMIFLYQLATKYALEYQSIIWVYSKWIIVFAFNITFLVLFGGGIGKLIFGVRVVNSKGNYPTITEAIIRSFPMIVSGLIAANNEMMNYEFGYAISGFLVSIFSIGLFVFFLLDGLSILINNERRAIHDQIAGTYVIKKDSINTFKSNTLEG